MISIHTPAQGVTGLDGGYFDKLSDFNPHSRTGSDFRDDRKPSQFMEFQSTLPHRE